MSDWWTEVVSVAEVTSSVWKGVDGFLASSSKDSHLEVITED